MRKRTKRPARNLPQDCDDTGGESKSTCFEIHPGEKTFFRPPTELEKVEHNLVPGTTVFVIRAPDGSERRIYIRP
jgi:hypothetical protein